MWNKITNIDIVGQGGGGGGVITEIKEWFQNTGLLEGLNKIKGHNGQRSLQSFWEESQMHFLNMN
jgi:hypothetical protein